jgi:2-methylisocitrate lyase-like PEP mutase family enzyme
MSMGRKLRNLMQDHKFLYTPGITTPLHAMIVEKARFQFVYMGGYDVSLTLLGLPMGAFHQFAGFPRIKEFEAKYLPTEEVKNKYEQSVGL